MLEEPSLAAGIKEQIDDLDHLLDQLLKLPIDRMQAAPATILMKPRVAAIAEEHAEIEEESPTLRFGAKEVETNPVLTLTEEVEESKVLENEVEEERAEAQPIEKVQEESPHSIRLSIVEPLTPSLSHREEEGSQTLTQSSVPVHKVPVEEIPWIDDEPVATGPGKGPAVEIIMGPTSHTIVTKKREDSPLHQPAPKRRGWVFWIFWTITWCFDNTMGYWVPWLRRPSVKFLLGLVGVVLFAISIYLVWIGWLK